jgi:Coenzyme PQQ synthesis protein D (PqqD)
MDKSKQQMPRARQHELLVHELADEILVYDLNGHKAHSLNKAAALVWQRCDGEGSITDIARVIEENWARQSTRTRSCWL